MFNKSLWGITARNLSKKKNDQEINLMIQILEWLVSKKCIPFSVAKTVSLIHLVTLQTTIMIITFSFLYNHKTPNMSFIKKQLHVI